MKTFKLVGLQIEDTAVTENSVIPLKDGLVINKEDGENSWLIEALISKEWLPLFNAHMEQPDTQLKVLVTISKTTNTPAQISASVKNITELDESISVLLDGRLLARSV